MQCAAVGYQCKVLPYNPAVLDWTVGSRSQKRSVTTRIPMSLLNCNVCFLCSFHTSKNINKMKKLYMCGKHRSFKVRCKSKCSRGNSFNLRNRKRAVLSQMAALWSMKNDPFLWASKEHSLTAAPTCTDSYRGLSEAKVTTRGPFMEEPLLSCLHTHTHTETRSATNKKHTCTIILQRLLKDKCVIEYVVVWT